MAEEVIIPDSAQNDNFKLNLKNLFTFLSSLDYLKSLEFSNAMRYMDSKQFYFTGEKQSLIMFVYSHTSFWVFITYLLLLLTAKMVFDVPTMYGVLAIGLVWLLFGFWFVNKYTWGDGYLWSVTRDFMVNIAIASVIISITTDFIILYLIPIGYKMLVEWANSGSKEGPLNILAESVIVWIQTLFKPAIKEINTNIKEFLPAYLSISAVKIFSFTVPAVYMFYLHKKRKNPQERLNNLLKRIS